MLMSLTERFARKIEKGWGAEAIDLGLELQISENFLEGSPDQKGCDHRKKIFERLVATQEKQRGRGSLQISFHSENPEEVDCTSRIFFRLLGSQGTHWVREN